MKEIKSVSTNEKIYTTSIFGPLLWFMIIVLIIILIGMFFWYNSLQTESVESSPIRPTVEQNREPESRNAQTDVMVLEALSTSDTIEAIQNDIDNTNTSNLTTEIEIIDRELERFLGN